MEASSSAGARRDEQASSGIHFCPVYGEKTNVWHSRDRAKVYLPDFKLSALRAHVRSRYLPHHSSLKRGMPPPLDRAFPPLPFPPAVSVFKRATLNTDFISDRKQKAIHMTIYRCCGLCVPFMRAIHPPPPSSATSPSARRLPLPPAVMHLGPVIAAAVQYLG